MTVESNSELWSGMACGDCVSFVVGLLQDKWNWVDHWVFQKVQTQQLENPSEWEPGMLVQGVMDIWIPHWCSGYRKCNEFLYRNSSFLWVWHVHILLVLRSPKLQQYSRFGLTSATHIQGKNCFPGQVGWCCLGKLLVFIDLRVQPDLHQDLSILLCKSALQMLSRVWVGAWNFAFQRLEFVLAFVEHHEIPEVLLNPWVHLH